MCGAVAPKMNILNINRIRVGLRNISIKGPQKNKTPDAKNNGRCVRSKYLHELNLRMTAFHKGNVSTSATGFGFVEFPVG